MGAKAGLDTQVMLDVINVSSGRNSTTLDRVPQCVLPRTFPMRFVKGGHDDWDDGSGRLAPLAPLRTDVLSGDLRLFYLLWLTAVQDEFVPEDEVEPLPGIAPLTGALEGFAEFSGIDPDLVQAAAQLGADDAPISRGGLRHALAAIPEREKVELLLRAVDGDLYVGAELRSTRKTGQLPHTALPVEQETNAATQPGTTRR